MPSYGASGASQYGMNRTRAPTSADTYVGYFTSNGAAWTRTDTGQTWICCDEDNGIWTPVPRRLIRTDTLSTDSASLVSDTTLTFPVESGYCTSFRFGVLFESTSATVGLVLAVSTPAFTWFGATSQIPQNGSMGTGFHTASDDERIGSSVAAANTPYFATFEGTIVPSTGGNVALRVRPSTAATIIRIRPGSYVEYSQQEV